MPQPEQTFEQRLVKVFSGKDLATSPQERAMLQHLDEEKQMVSRLRGGSISPVEFNQWKEIELRSMRDQGISPSDVEAYAQNMYTSVRSQVGLESKTASMSKWAEMLKSIPAPEPRQISTVRAHAAAMPSLPPEVLDQMSESPGDCIRGCARLGIVMRPEEFQHVMLKGQHPDLHQEWLEGGNVFAPCPVHPEEDPTFRPDAPVAADVMPKIMELVKSILPDRSFAPMAVRIQIIRARPMGDSPPPSVPTSHPVLDEVARLYNNYRSGLLAHPPDWRYVPGVDSNVFTGLGEETKVADAAQEMSRQLLYLAFWPGFLVG
jgi:hypothetical protein